MSEIRQLELRGEAGERGYQHGQALCEDIGVFYEEWIRHARSGPKPQVEDALLSYAMAHLPATKRYAPDLVDEVDGIAQGAGIAFEKAFFLNCFDEANCHGPDLLT